MSLDVMLKLTAAQQSSDFYKRKWRNLQEVPLWMEMKDTRTKNL